MGVRFATDNSGTLHKDLKAYWTLDETGGLRRDLVGLNHLTDKNSVTRARGRGVSTQAGQFTAANSEYLSIPHNAALSTGDIDFSICTWVYLDSKVTDRKIYQKGVVGTTSEYRAFYDAAGDRFKFGIEAPDHSSVLVTANSFGSPATGTWYFIVAWHDSVLNTINIQVNNGAVDSTSHSAGVQSAADTLYIGTNATAGQFWNGRIAKIGFWKKVLTSTERAALYNNGRGLYYSGTTTRFYPTHTSSLTTSLIAWWELDETSGTRFDMVSPGTGPAAQFTATNSEYLSVANNTSIQAGDIDFTWAIWVYADTAGAINRHFVTKGNTNPGALEYTLRTVDIGGGNSRFRFQVFDGGTTTVGSVTANSFGNIAANTWYFIVAWHDSVGNTANIQVNNGTVDSASTTGTPGTNTEPLFIGAQGEPSNFWDGRISLVGFWKKVLSSSERTSLYNGGVGQHNRDLTGTLRTSLISYWDLNEGSGTRFDAPGLSGNNLTDNNTVTQATGVAGGNSVGDNNTVTRAQGLTVPNPLGSSGQFTSANTEYLKTSSHSSLVPGDNSFTIACWVYPDSSSPSTVALVTKYGTTTATREYWLGLVNSASRVEFDLYGSSGQIATGGSFEVGEIVVGSWNLVIAWYDQSAATVYVQINNGRVWPAVVTGAVQTTGEDFRIGIQGGESNPFNGRLAEVGFWKKALTASERADLYNGGFANSLKATTFSPDSTRNLRTGLVSWWKLDEVSGTRLDFISGNDLTDNNTVTQAVGKNGRGKAGQFTRANSEFLSIVDNADLSTGDIDFTIAFWLNADSFTDEGIMGKGDNTTPNREWLIAHRVASNRFSFEVSTSGTGIDATVQANALGTPAINTWYFIVCWHDSVANTINIQVNNGTVDSVSYSGGLSNLAGSFRIGRIFNSASFFDGRIDDVGFWKRVLTAQERTNLYNAGKGTTPGTRFVKDNTVTLADDLIAYWKLEEDSGSRFDYIGGNLLTDNNTVTRAESPLLKGNAGQFVAVNSEYLSIADNLDVSTGDIDFTIAAWVYMDSKTAEALMTIASKQNPDGAASDHEWGLGWFNSTDRFRFETAGTDVVSANSLGSPATGTWYLIIAWHDSAANTINIQVNNSSIDTANAPTAISDTARPFQIGAQFRTGGTGQFRFWDGRIDEVAMWKRILTAAERTALYNAR